MAAGLAVGCAFILASKKVLDKYEHLKFVGFEGVCDAGSYNYLYRTLWVQVLMRAVFYLS